MTEKGLQDKILKYLRDQKHFVFKCMVGNENGLPDIIACIDGWFVAIEVKNPGLKGRVETHLTELQVYQLDRIKASQGLTIVTNDYDDFIEKINKIEEGEYV